MTYMARPEFDDTRLQDKLHWIADNALLLSQFAHSLGYSMRNSQEKRSYNEFLNQQWKYQLRHFDPSKPECTFCRRHHGMEITHEHE